MDDAVKERGRNFLKTSWVALEKEESDKKKNIPAPPLENDWKLMNPDAAVIDLPEWDVGQGDSFVAAVENRRSRRKFSDRYLSLENLSFLLWSTQGVKKVRSVNTFRVVPSGGARHPFETYLYVQRVEGLKPGLYKYLAIDHKLAFIREIEDMEKKLDHALLSHNFGSAVTFVWAAVPYRTEWSYSFEAYRLILLDAGHVCQNLYLACEITGNGTCAVGAYDQDALDKLTGLDGQEEMAVYVAPVGVL